MRCACQGTAQRSVVNKRLYIYIKIKISTLPPQGRQYGPLSYIFSPHLRASRGVGAPGPEDGGVVNSPHCDADFGGVPKPPKMPKKAAFSTV